MRKFKTKPTGRPPRIKDIKKTISLRKKGLSIREISRAVLKREDPRTIHRWLTSGVGKKLSTVK
jgi:hypothetical protein